MRTTLIGAPGFRRWTKVHHPRTPARIASIAVLEQRGRRWLLAAAVLAVAAVAVTLALRSGNGQAPHPSPAGGGKPPRAAGKGCDRSAHDEASLAAQFAAASAGQAICLASGDYGTFRAGKKSGPVTVRPAPGAHPRMSLDFNAVSGVRLQRLRIAAATIAGASHDIQIRDSVFTGRAYVDASQLAGARIVFDGNTHVNIDTCDTCPQGRVHVSGDSGHPAGVLIAHSLFKGGNADGVRADAPGVRIVGNEFTGFRDEGHFHTDPIQLAGGVDVLIKGNWIHDNDVSAGIMIADGTAHDVIEDNVVSASGSPFAITLYSDDGSLIAHNTFADGVCKFGKRCGIVNLGSKVGAATGKGTMIRNNVLGGIIADDNGGQSPPPGFTAEHNLVRDGAPGNQQGVPTYAGPRSRYSGFRLASVSAGRREASDGGAVGIPAKAWTVGPSAALRAVGP